MARITLTVPDLDLAVAMCAAARAEASAQGALVSVAVVDAGGHLVAFQRMDGAEIAGPVLARDKAFTAVAHRVATADLAPLVAPGGELAGMPSADGGRYVCFPGGLPLWSQASPGGPGDPGGPGGPGDPPGARVVGGIGVSGGTAAQDVACARAALALWPEGNPQP